MFSVTMMDQAVILLLRSVSVMSERGESNYHLHVPVLFIGSCTSLNHDLSISIVHKMNHFLLVLCASGSS